jgi:thiol-disulfide isomerase/thioredoxin
MTALLPLWLGCAGDRDGDGVLDAEERRLGLDPDRSDTDGDQLDDGDELDRGTDPADADTDDDRYLDGDEVLEDTDPLDPDSRIYVGAWPYFRDKDVLGDGAFDGGAVAVDDVFGRLVARDQYGDTVDLYDFGGTGALTVIDASATWCEPCRTTSAWLAGTSDDYGFDVLGYAPVREAVRQRTVRWVTVLTDGVDRPADLRAWADAYPAAEVPVLDDPRGEVHAALNVGATVDGDPYAYYPSFVVVDGTMRVQVRGFAWDALDYVLARLPTP